MIEQLLGKLGFSDKEVQVYLTLLQHGKMSPVELAKLTRINRPTVYSVTKELVKKGVILEDLGGPTLTFHAKPPADLIVLVNREQKSLEEKKGLVQSAVQELQKLDQSTTYSIPKIVFIPEEEVERYLYKQMTVWNKSIVTTDGIYWGFQDPTFVEVYKEWIDTYWQSNPSGITLQLLSNQSPVETEMQTKEYRKRKIRFWDGAGSFSATTWAMGDYVVMISTHQHPYHLVEIHDAMFAQNLRQLFKGIWEFTENSQNQR